MSEVVYLDTSAVLRAVLEDGLSADIEGCIADARILMTSRLSLVESARAFLRLRLDGLPEEVIADASREADSIWARCVIWELTPSVCDLAGAVAPGHRLRSLDALQLATWLIARRRLGDVRLVTADRRLEEAVARS
jgi:predicted nucleic acid-binding protein